jgi:RHS repeat-associated protein
LFTYDADNSRVHMHTSTGVEEWYAGQRYERARIAGGFLHRYRIWREGVEIAQVTREVVGDQLGAQVTRYLHTDLLGTPSLVTDSAGAVIGRPQYDPFGKTIESARASSVMTGFTGHREDVGIGLIDMRGRFYDPVTARFLSTDPWLDALVPQSLNPYSYVLNSPLRFIDPSGFAPYVPDPTQWMEMDTLSDTVVFCDGAENCIQGGETISITEDAPVVTEGAWGTASRVGDRYYVQLPGQDWMQVDFATYDLVQFTIWKIGSGSGLATLTSAANVINGIAAVTIAGLKLVPTVGLAFRIAETIAAPPTIEDGRGGIRSAGGPMGTGGKGGPGRPAHPADSVLKPGGRLVGKPGSNKEIRMMEGGMARATELFDQLTQGGRAIEGSTYPGTLVEVPGGGTVGIRATSTSGPPTIDVRIPGIGIREIKFP